MEEIILGMIALLLLAIVIGMPVILAVLLVKIRRIDGLAQRLRQLEQQVSRLQTGESTKPVEPPAAVPTPPLVVYPHTTPEPVESEAVVAAEVIHDSFPPSRRDTTSLESMIGRNVLGWVAVVVLLFATAFFLRYAFENQWVGPLGRVTLGIVAGLVLVWDGRRRHRGGWHIFAQMLTAGGVVLLYLSMFGAFGFYHLIGQRDAGIFLFLLVVETALLAVAYEAPAIALMAVIGGLLTPLLMHSDRDQYVSLFTYLGVLNVGVVGLLLRRAWPAIGTVALLGTQLLFWLWYGESYHPEKLAWALGFQAVVFVLYLHHSLVANFSRRPMDGWEDVVRMPLNAALWSTAAYVLLDEDYHAWMGSLAVGMAAVYALAARWLLVARRDQRLLLVAVTIAMSFLAIAFPLQAETTWVTLGWAAEASVLWWFGVRVCSGPLRLMAAIFAGLAVGHLLSADTPTFTRNPFTPIFNAYALPALATTACLSLALIGTRRRVMRLGSEERVLVAIAAMGCALLPWFILSVDLWGYFDTQAVHALDKEKYDWSRMAQMTLSAWWSVYAFVLLTLGFRTRQAWLRWTALGLLTLTVAKVFLFDMAGLDQIYRIVAFFVLAIVLGIAAWAYQRMQPDPVAAESV